MEKKGKDKVVVFFLPEFYILLKSDFFGSLAIHLILFVSKQVKTPWRLGNNPCCNWLCTDCSWETWCAGEYERLFINNSLIIIINDKSLSNTIYNDASNFT